MPAARRVRRLSQSPRLEPARSGSADSGASDAGDDDGPDGTEKDGNRSGSESDDDNHMPETQFVPASDSSAEETLYLVKQVLGENTKDRLYLLEWEGVDPDTGYEYRPSWEPKEGCTDLLIQEWKARVARKPALRDIKWARQQLKEWDEGYTKWQRLQQRKKGMERRGGKKGRGQSESGTPGVKEEGKGGKRKRGDEHEEDDAVKSKKKARGAANRQASVASSAAPSATSASPAASASARQTRSSIAANATPTPDKADRPTRPTRSHTASVPPSKTKPRSSLRNVRADTSEERSTSASPPKTRVKGDTRGRGKGNQAVGFADEVIDLRDDDDDDGEEAQVVEAGVDVEQDEGDDADLDILDHVDDADLEADEPEPTRKSPRASKAAAAAAASSSSSPTALAATDKGKEKGKAKGKTTSKQQPESSQSQADTTFDEETFPDPRAADDETYRPPPPAARATRAHGNGAVNAAGKSKDTAKSTSTVKSAAGAKPGKSRALGPVPQPSLSAFKQPAPPAQPEVPTQATVSTQDDIQTFSSPAASAQQQGKKQKQKQKQKQKRTNNSQSTDGSGESHLEETGLIKKRVNGEVVLVPAHAGSQDGTQSDAEDEGEGEVAIRAINDEAVDEAADAQADDESAAAGAYPETQMPGMSRQRVGGEDVFIPDHQDDSSDDDNGETPSQAPGAAGDGPEAAAVGRTASAAQTQAETAAIVTTDEVIEELATAAVQVLVEETLPLATQSADEAATATATAIATSPPALVHAAAQTTEVEVEVQAQAPARAKVAQQGVQVQQGELLEREPGVGQEEPPSASDVAAAATAAKVSELLAADGDEDLPTSVSDLQALVRSLQRRNASLVEETSFLREQHSSVSTIASEQAREASRLHAEVERKTKQLRTAVRQRDTHWKAIISARDSSEAQLRGTIKILTDQSRRTDDAIRHKAVMYDRMEAQCERMEMEHVPLKKRVEALGQRNEVLQAQVQALRARQMGADGGRGDGDENEHGRGHRHGRTRGSGSGSGSGSEEEDSAEETDMGEDADAGSDGGFGTESDAESTGDEGGGGGGGGNRAGEDYREQMRRKGYAVRQETASFASAYDPSQGPALQTAPGIAVQADQTQQVGLEAVPEGTVMDVLGNEVECRYEVEGGVCGLIADSREALQEHLRLHTVGIQPLP